MSIQSEITRITTNIANSLTAVAAKGVTVPSGSTSDDLPTLIAAIQQGGGGAGRKKIIIEADGNNWVVTYSDFETMAEVIADASGSHDYEDIVLFKIISKFDSSTTPPTEAECEVYNLVRTYTISESSGSGYAYYGRLTFTSIVRDVSSLRRTVKTINMYCEMDDTLNNAGFTFSEDVLVQPSVSSETLSL